MRAANQHEYGPCGHCRCDQKQPELPLDIGAVQKTKGRSTVTYVHKVKQTLDHRNGSVFRDGLHDNILAQLIKRQCQQGHAPENTVTFAHNPQDSITLITAVQRGHKAG